MKRTAISLTLILLGITSLPMTGRAERMSEDELIRYIHSLDSFRSLRHHKDARPFTDEEYRRALRGEVFARLIDAEGGGKIGMAIKVFDAPIWKVWAAATNRRDYVDLNEQLKASDILYEGDGLVTVYHFAKPPTRFLSDRQWVLDTHANAEIYKASGGKIWEYYWSVNPKSKEVIYAGFEAGKINKEISKKKIDKAVILEKNDGSFYMIALPDGRTLVEGYSNNDPGGNIPKFVADSLAKKSIPDSLDALARFIEKHFDRLLSPNHPPVIGPDGKLVRPIDLKPAS